MKTKIQKMIEDYRGQLIDYDKQREILGANVQECRKGEGPWDLEELRQDRKIVDAQRQRTVQFISDLKYLKEMVG